MNRYDNHREQILRGSQTDYEDESLDVFPYFTAACYKGFGDDDGGFYAVYANLFDQIASEDIEFMDSPEEYEEIPKFGTSTSDYETVVKSFYAHWQGYQTKKSYSWLCPHNINEIRDRRILREIEKETKKLAQRARKKRNDEIRALVSFVRKRDKRVHEHNKKLEERAEQNRLKQQQHRLAQIRRNQQEAEEMRQAQKSVFNTSDHEEQLRQMEEAYRSDSSGSEYDDEDDEDENDDLDGEVCDIEGVANADGDNGAIAEEYYVDDLYCVACNKSFKNASSYENHESSKKHRDNIERLRKTMQAEEEDYQNSSDSEQNEEAVDEEEEGEIEEIAPISKSNKKSKKSRKAKVCNVVEDDLDDVEEPMAGISLVNETAVDDKNNWSDDAKKGKKAKGKKANRNAASGSKTVTQAPEAECADEAEATELPNKQNSKKSKKSSAKGAEPKEIDSYVDVSHTCVTCSSVFDSKNRLFAHLKKTNHGVYLPKSNGAATETKRGKKK